LAVSVLTSGRASELALIMHPIGAVRRTNLYNMVLILLSMILAAIAVAISMIHSSFGILAESGVAREVIAVEREQSRTTSPTKHFLIVVLPDGKVVNPMVSERF
jgi:hypothetical protein